MHSTISALPTGSTYSAERLRRQDTEREGMLQLGGMDIVSKAKAKKGKKIEIEIERNAYACGTEKKESINQNSKFNPIRISSHRT